MLIPAPEELIEDFNIAKRILTLHLPEGLLEL